MGKSANECQYLHHLWYTYVLYSVRYTEVIRTSNFVWFRLKLIDNQRKTFWSGPRRCINFVRLAVLQICLGRKPQKVRTCLPTWNYTSLRKRGASKKGARVSESVCSPKKKMGLTQARTHVLTRSIPVEKKNLPSCIHGPRNAFEKRRE